MSDTVLALGITVLLLAGLAAWVPLLHAAERLTRRSERVVSMESPQSRERVVEPEINLKREIA